MANLFWLRLPPPPYTSTRLSSANEEFCLETYQPRSPATIAGHVRKPAANEEGASHFWSRASTWALLLPLLYFALDGVSPFVNSGTAMRAVQTSSSSGVFFDRFSNILIFGVCMMF